MFRRKSNYNCQGRELECESCKSARGTSHGNGRFVGLQCVKTDASNLTLDVTLLLPVQKHEADDQHFSRKLDGIIFCFFLHCKYPLVMTNSLLLKMAIERVDFPMKMLIFHSYVSLPL